MHSAGLNGEIRDVMDALDAHIALLGRGGEIVAVNAAWERFAWENGGTHATCGVGVNYLTICQADTTDPHARSAQAGIAGVLDGSLPSFSMTYPCHAPDGERWFLMMARSLPRSDGGGALVIHTDVTVSHLAAARARRQERRFASLIEHAVDLITVMDLDGTITYESPAFESMLGYSSEDATRTNAFAFLHPGDVEILRQAVADTSNIPSGTVCREFRMRHRDGSWRWIEATLTNLLGDPDVGGIVVNSRDVTERKTAAAALAERAESFSTLFHGTAEAMIIHDGKVFVAVNRPYAELLGLKVEALVGRRLLDFVAPESHALALEQMQRQSEVPYDLVARRADGSTFPVEVLGRKIRYEDRWLRLLTVRDVTQRRQAEEALRESEARFRALVQEASDIVVVFDATGGVQYASPALERMLGHPVESSAGALRLDLVHFDDREAVARAWATIVAAPRARLRITYRTRNVDGAWVWLDAILTNLLDVPAVAGIVMNARDVSEQKRLESELRHLALHDPLTGLPNRTLLADRMDHALLQAAQQGNRVGILFLDLDYFKHVNDIFGHAAGDALLHSVAVRLASVLRASETLARVGGDEFVVLLPSILHERDALAVADRLQSVMVAPFVWNGRDVVVGVTIGIAVAESGMVRSEVLLRDGDAALYSAKRAGRGRSVVHTSGLTGNAVRRWTLKTDLRNAVDRREFVLHYQPIVDLETGRVDQVEALIRWHHPRYGLVPPDEFIPVAEETGHIVAIGRWVMDEVCRQLHQWEPESPAIAVNLPAAQFNDRDLVREVTSALAEFAIDPRKLQMEITEHMLIEDLVTTASTLKLLRELGVGVAIDDFGTGYSSLRYLQELPVDVIKLDRSFVQGLESNAGALAIVEGITSLAHAIGLSVTAEGIETVEQLARLRGIGCDRGQGFLLAVPKPAAEEAPNLVIPLLPHTAFPGAGHRIFPAGSR